MACRNCDQNLFTFTVRLEPDNTILLDESEDSPAMDKLWSRISKSVNALAGLNPEGVRELVRVVEGIWPPGKILPWNPKQGTIEISMEKMQQIGTALSAVRLKDV